MSTPTSSSSALSAFLRGFVDTYVVGKTESQRNKLLMTHVRGFREHDGEHNRILQLMHERDKDAAALPLKDKRYWRMKKDQFRSDWMDVLPLSALEGKKSTEKQAAKYARQAEAHNTMAADTVIVLEVGEAPYLILANIIKPLNSDTVLPTWNQLLHDVDLRSKWLRIVPANSTELKLLHEPKNRLEPSFDPLKYQQSHHAQRKRRVKQSYGYKALRELPQLDIRMALRFADVKFDKTLAASGGLPASALTGLGDGEGPAPTPTRGSNSDMHAYSTLTDGLRLHLKTGVQNLTITSRDSLNEPTIVPRHWIDILPIPNYIPWVLPVDGRIMGARFEIESGIWDKAVDTFLANTPSILALLRAARDTEPSNLVPNANQWWLVETANIIVGAPDRFAAQMLSNFMGEDAVLHAGPTATPPTVDAALRIAFSSPHWHERRTLLVKAVGLAVALSRAWEAHRRPATMTSSTSMSTIITKKVSKKAHAVSGEDASATPDVEFAGDLDWRQWHDLPDQRRFAAAFKLCFMLTPPVYPNAGLPTLLRAWSRSAVFMNPPASGARRS